LSELINKILEHAAKVNEPSDPNTVFVTDLVHCSHRRALTMLKPELRKALTYPALIGSLLHRGLQDKVMQLQLNYTAEERLEYRLNEYTVVGRVDLVNHEYIYEIKYSSTLPDKVKPEHMLQLRVYQTLYRLVKGEHRKGKVVYITPMGVREYTSPGELLLSELTKLLDETVKDTAHPRWRGECFTCPLKFHCDLINQK